MPFITKLDLTKQSRIDINTIASYDGSLSIGQKFFISGIQIDPTNPIGNYVLTYNPITNSFFPAPSLGGSLPDNRPFYGMAISAVTNLTYYVTPGIYEVSGVFYNFTGGTITLASGNSSFDRFDSIYVTGTPNANQLFALQGTPASPPQIPTVSGDTAVIGIIRIGAGTTPTTGSINIYYITLISSDQVQYVRGIYQNLTQYLDGNYIRPYIYNFTNNINELTFGQTGTSITFNWGTNKTGYQYTLNPIGNNYNNLIFNASITGQTITGSTSNTATTYNLIFDDGITTTQASTYVKFYNERYIGSYSGFTPYQTDVYNFQFIEHAKNNKMDLKKVSNVNGNYIHIYEPSIGNVYSNIQIWSNHGSGNGQLNNPFAIAIDSDKHVYITDAFNQRVQVFDEFGKFLFKFGSFGTGNTQFSSQIGGIALDPLNNIYVCDTFNQRIQVFDRFGNFLFKFGNGGTGNGQFNNAYGINIMQNGNILVADTYNNRLQLFNSVGTFISVIGSAGSGDNQYSLPIGVTSDKNNNIYVADLGNSRVQVLDSGGTFSYKFGSLGSSNGQLNQPFGIALDNDKNIYVLDNNNNRVEVFDVLGNYLFQIPTSYTIGSSAGIGLALSPTNNYQIYLSERSTASRIFKYVLNDSDLFVNGLYTNDFNKKLITFTNEYGYSSPYFKYTSNNQVYDDKLFVEFR